MRRCMIIACVLLTVCAAAQAVTSVYAEITYPTVTTWKLWLTECDWTGSLPITPSGYGIAAFAIDVKGVRSAFRAVPPPIIVSDDQDPPAQGNAGFSIGSQWPTADPDSWSQLFAAQDPLGGPERMFHGFGVTAGQYDLPAGWTATGSFSWLAPGVPGSATPGVLVFSGKRDWGQTVTISWDDVTRANVFDNGESTSVSGVQVVPEPATLALLVLAGLAVRRRR
jgi:hypothetical protein